MAELKEEDMPMVNKKGCIKAPLNKHMILEPYGVQLVKLGFGCVHCGVLASKLSQFITWETPQLPIKAMR